MINCFQFCFNFAFKLNLRRYSMDPARPLTFDEDEDFGADSDDMGAASEAGA
jgi:hypothetical protein